MPLAQVNFGWLLDLLFRGWVKRMIEKMLAEVGAQLPVTFYFQSGTVKARIVIDEI